ncbi:HTH-type transcriptional activator Btr [compost metagenome]
MGMYSKYGVNIRWTSRYDYKQGGRLNLHEHDFYQIIYFIDGKGEFTCGNVTHPIAPGVLFFIRPEVKHGFVPYGNARIKTLDLKFDIYDNEMLDVAKGLHAYQTDESSKIKAFLESIRYEGLYKPLFYGELASVVLIQIIYMLARRSESGKGSSNDINAIGSNGGSTQSGHSAHKLRFQAILPVMDKHGKNEPVEAAHRLEHYIQEHYAEELTLESISEQLCYSKNYLSHSFRMNVGSTFTRYLRKIRIERSKELIAYSTLSLKQIAESVGFKTVHHFSRVFKETEGINPGEWKIREHDGIRKDVHFD